MAWLLNCVRCALALALALASAVLYFHDTPWLEETWSMGDIYIMDQQSLLTDQPYISENSLPHPALWAQAHRDK